MAQKQTKTGKHSRSALKQQIATEGGDEHQESTAESAASDLSSQSTVAMPPLDRSHSRKDRLFADGAASSGMEGGEGFATAAPLNNGESAFSAVNPAQPFNGAGEGGAPGWTGAGGEGAKKERDMKKVAKVIGIIVGVVAAVYLVGVFVFSTHFYPGTTLAGTDVSFKSSGDFATLAESKSTNYAIAVTGDGMNFTITADQAGLNVNGSKVASTALAANNAFLWPYELTQKHDETPYLVAEYNSNGLETLVKQKVEEFNTTATDPVNATIAYSDSTGAFAVKSEELGTKLNVTKVLQTVDDAVMNMESTVTLNSDELVQPTVFKDDAALATAAQQANAYVKADLTLVMGSSSVKAAEINAKQISQWVVLDANKNVSFDTNAMTAWVQSLADSLNTVGSTRTYTRGDGQVITVTGGTYGWDVDSDSLVQQVTSGITAGSKSTITIPTNQDAATFTGAGQRDWGLYVDVDISEQHARCYDASNALLWEADVVTGTPDGTHETPEGVWTIYNKQSPSVLKGDIIQTTGQPEWECTVQYWMAFTPSGCGLHDAYWQSAFGGTRYMNGYGSHGCVNLSDSAAASIYSIVSCGDTVVVHA